MLCAYAKWYGLKKSISIYSILIPKTSRILLLLDAWAMARINKVIEGQGKGNLEGQGQGQGQGPQGQGQGKWLYWNNIILKLF